MDAFLLLAAGSGSRMRGVLDDKVLAPLAGRAPLLRCLDAVHASALPGAVLLVVRDEAQRLRMERLLAGHPVLARITWVQGGGERRESVRNGLALVPAGAELVFVHDCARPLLTAALLRSLREEATRHGSAVLAHRVVDTLKEVPEDALPLAGNVPTPLRTIDRSRLWGMETPQVFRRELITRAYAHAFARGLHTTDEAAAVEALGEPVRLVENPGPNPKLTTPADVAYVEYLLATGGK